MTLTSSQMKLALSAMFLFSAMSQCECFADEKVRPKRIGLRHEIVRDHFRSAPLPQDDSMLERLQDAPANLNQFSVDSRAATADDVAADALPKSWMNTVVVTRSPFTIRTVAMRSTSFPLAPTFPLEFDQNDLTDDLPAILPEPPESIETALHLDHAAPASLQPANLDPANLELHAAAQVLDVEIPANAAMPGDVSSGTSENTVQIPVRASDDGKSRSINITINLTNAPPNYSTIKSSDWQTQAIINHSGTTSAIPQQSASHAAASHQLMMKQSATMQTRTGEMHAVASPMQPQPAFAESATLGLPTASPSARVKTSAVPQSNAASLAAVPEQSPYTPASSLAASELAELPLSDQGADAGVGRVQENKFLAVIQQAPSHPIRPTTPTSSRPTSSTPAQATRASSAYAFHGNQVVPQTHPAGTMATPASSRFMPQAKLTSYAPRQGALATGSVMTPELPASSCPATASLDQPIASQGELLAMANDSLRLADNAMKRGTALLARGYARQALTQLARATRLSQGRGADAGELTIALTALRENIDFERFGDMDPDAIVRLVNSHQTPVLKQRDLHSISQQQAARAYHDYAEMLLSESLQSHPIASRALVLMSQTESYAVTADDQAVAGNQACLLRAALNCDAGNVMAYEELGEVLIKLGYFDQAKRVLDASYQMNASPKTLRMLATCSRKLGNNQAAADYDRQWVQAESNQANKGLVVQLNPEQFAQMSQRQASFADAPANFQSAAVQPFRDPAAEPAPAQSMPAKAVSRLTKPFRSLFR